MGTVISKQPSLLTYGFGETVDYVDHLEFKASVGEPNNKECRKDFDRLLRKGLREKSMNEPIMIR